MLLLHFLIAPMTLLASVVLVVLVERCHTHLYKTGGTQ